MNAGGGVELLDETVTITSRTGVRFNVRYLRTGDRYGLDDRLVKGEGTSLRLEGPGDTVEFYDSRYPHTPRGQFIARYGVDTIIDGSHGLDLMTYEPSWKIDAAAMFVVREWLRIQRERGRGESA